MKTLDDEYGDEVASEVEDATTAANKSLITEEFGFTSHGLVIYDETGTLREKIDGHLMKEPAIRAALDRTLAAPDSAAG